MDSLQTFFAESGSSDIHTIARYVQGHVDANWQTVFDHTHAEMNERYAEIGDSVYAIYGTHLFRHIHDQLKQVGIRATPRLPGSLSISREWGDDESDRQRWMWSKLTKADGTAVGTLVTVFYHDHVQLRIPRPFHMIALEVTSKGAVVDALSQLSADFKNALEARIEYAQYLEQDLDA